MSAFYNPNVNKRLKRKAEKKRKEGHRAQLGYCHGCGKPWTKLTYEHIPPARVQALIPEKCLRFNPFEESTLKPKKKLPPCTIARGGLRVKSFGECCQQLTQTQYGQAFFDWSRIVWEMCKNLPSDEDRLTAIIQIEPLAIIKKIAAMALAASEFNNNKDLAMLRDFIQMPERIGLPPAFDFYAYVNPVRYDYKLPQCRLVRKICVVKDMVTREQAMVLTEISVPPLGYVVLYHVDEPLDASARQLMYLNNFATVPLNQLQSVALDIPIRTPFGPFPLRYIQDARREPRRINPSRIS